MRGFERAGPRNFRRSGVFAIFDALKFSARTKLVGKERADRSAGNIFEIELDGVHFIHDAFLQSRIFQHLAVGHSLFVIADALKRSGGNKGRVDRLRVMRNQASFFTLGLSLSGAPPSAAATTPATACASLFTFCLGLLGYSHR